MEDIPLFCRNCYDDDGLKEVSILNERSNFPNNIVDKFEHLEDLSFHKKNEYLYKLKKWLFEITDRNFKILKDEYKKEKVHRIRQNVYCIDFGVNIGSEFNFFHFCVVIKEFDYIALIVPISTEKEDDNDWKSAGNFIIPIGEIEDMPYDKKPCYAMVNQMRAVSKQRLTDYYDNRQKKHIHMTLNKDQMKKIFDAIVLLGTQPIKIANKG